MKIEKPCTKCIISNYRRKIVIGRGDVPARLLFIGEAPGKTEDLLGTVFIGAAGQLLDKMILDAVNLANYCPSYYITNCLRCRPANKKFGDNREPSPIEILNCMDNLMSIYYLVDPEVVVFIGKVAEEFYKREFRTYRTVTHPAALLRGGGAASPYYLSNINVLLKVFLSLKESQNGKEEKSNSYKIKKDT